MSQHDGVSSSLASIESAPPNRIETTGTSSHSHSLTSSNTSTALQSSDSSRSGAISGRVEIPKLSTTTTELLARFARNIKETQQQVLPRDDQIPVSWSPFPLSSDWNIQNTNPRGVGTMRASSTLIELPTAPFVYPTRVEAPVVTPANPVPALAPSSNGINGAQAESDGSVNIPPNPIVTYSTSMAIPAGPRVPADIQPRPEHQPPSSNHTTGTPAKPHGLVNIAPKPAATYSTSTLQTGVQVPANIQLPSEPQPPSSNGTNGTQATPHGSASILPKPGLTYSTSSPVPTRPQVPADIQLPSEHQRPPLPLAPLAPAHTILNTSKTSLPKPSTSMPVKGTSNTRQRRGTGNRKSGSKKRKHGNDSDGEDIIRAVDSSSDESDIAPAATQTKSGRQVNRPSLYVPSPLSPALPKETNNQIGASDKPQEATRSRKRVPRKGKNTNIICIYCQRGHSPPSNAIVFCDRCNRAWHQHCHDPPIGVEVVSVKEKEWLCRECEPVETTILHPTVVRSNPSLTSGPPVHPPLVIPRAEVGGVRFPTDDQRRFLSTLSHAALVEILLTISNKHPTLPMFPENMGSLPSSNFPPSQTVVAATTAPPTLLPSISTHNPMPSNLIHSEPAIGGENNGQSSTDLTSERTRKRHYYESSDDDSEYEFQEHRLYPRAGNGVFLSTNEEDLDILQEDPTCTTFSYALHKPPSAIARNVSS